MKIGINAGHTLKGHGTGANGFLSETRENRRIKEKLIKLLEKIGHKIIDCTIDESTNDLKDAVIKANNANVDLFCSIHLNAGGGNGTETYIYKKGGDAEKIAKKMNLLVSRSCNFNDRGIKEANFYVLKHTKAPAILLEVCFVDSIEDKEKLNDELVAKAIVQSITGSVFFDIYRVRKTWKDERSQLGAYRIFENAKKVAIDNIGYHVFNEFGESVF